MTNIKIYSDEDMMTLVMNRVHGEARYGQTIQGVCLKKMQFSCWNPMDPNRLVLQSEDRFKEPVWEKCHYVALQVSSGLWPDLTKGSNHYHARSIKIPFWARGVKPQVHMGQHVFYKL